MTPHVHEELQGLGEVPALLACARQGGVGDDVKLDALVPHVLAEPQSMREVLALVACARQG